MDPDKKAGVSYRFDDVLVDGNRRGLEKDGQPCKITPRSFDVLVYLVEHRDRIVEKQELFEEVWKEKFVTDNALTRVIREIRRVIGDDADAPRYVETLHKHGYRFIAKIREPEEAEPVTQKAEAPHVEEVLIPPAEPRNNAVAETIGAAPRVSRIRLSRSTLLVAALASISVALIALILWRIQPKLAPTETTGFLKREQITTSPGLDIFPTLSPDGNSIAYSSDHNGDFEIYSKQLTPDAREIQLTADGQHNFEPSWSPDGKLIAYCSKNRGGIWIVPATGGTAKQLTEFGSRPRWSRDGATIVFQSYSGLDLGAHARSAMPPSTIWLVSAQGGDPTPVTQAGNPPGGHGSPSWSPDGKRLVFTSDDFMSGGLWTISTRGDELKQVDKDLCFDPTYLPDGEAVYYARLFGLWKVRMSPTSGEVTGSPALIVSTAPMQAKHLTISADGKNLAYSQLSMASNLWSVPVSQNSSEAARPPTPLARNTNSRNEFPIFSPDGRKIAFSSLRSGVSGNISIVDADGQNQVQLTSDTSSSICSGWFPEGDQLAFVSTRDNRPTMWSVNLKSGRERLLLKIDQSAGYYTRLSPDGRTFAFNSKGRDISNIWTIPVEGGQAHQITFDNELMGFPCWSPDGKLLAFEMKRGDDIHIGVIPSSGGEPSQLTFGHGVSWPHSWSPDGDKIAFAGYRDGYWNVWWVSRSTKVQKQVTSYKKPNAYVRYPSWSPVGNQIVYEYAETTGNIWVIELK